MESTSLTTLPYNAGICFKYLKSRLVQHGINIVSANELFHQLRVSIRATWMMPRICFDIKILGRSESSDIYITHRRRIPIRFSPIDDLITKQIARIAAAIEAEA